MLVLAGMGQGLSQLAVSPPVEDEIPGYIELDGDTVNWRIGPRDYDIFIDKTITPVGFLGTEGVDWITVDRFTGIPVDTFQYIVYDNALVTTPAETIYYDGTRTVRKRILGTIYYIDVALTETGLDGIENTDWTWVQKITGQTAIFRSGVRDGDFVVDCEITATGFAGAEDTDWENLNTIPGGGALLIYRDGVRDEAYVIDKVLTATGFSGTEDTDWENIVTNKPM